MKIVTEINFCRHNKVKKRIKLDLPLCVTDVEQYRKDLKQLYKCEIDFVMQEFR